MEMTINADPTVTVAGAPGAGSVPGARPRVAICGLHTECSTFSPHVADRDDFTELRGEALLARYPWLVDPAGSSPVTPGGSTAATSYDRGWVDQVEWLPVLHARAMPGGPVRESAYLAWREEIVSGLRKLHEEAPLDGIYFDIHGAMNVRGMDDAEGDLISHIRAAIGDKPLVSATMDLHGNVSETLFRGCDLLTCFRLAPHEDTWETRERGARQLVHYLTRPGGPARPHKALVHVPILLPGEMTSTRLEPAKSLYASIAGEYEPRPGIGDISIWIGYAWADEPRSMATVMAYGDDAAAVEQATLELATRLRDAAPDFQFVAPAAQFDECLTTALEKINDPAERPFFISDSGDNPGAGGADDCTFALGRLLDRIKELPADATVVCASIFDAAAAHRAHELGVGATGEFALGGKIDTTAPGELTITATVGALGTDPSGGQVARLDVGPIKIFVTEKRTQYATLDMYRVLGVEPTQATIIVVKIGYLEPELHAIKGGWLLALTPGGVDQDIIRLGHQRVVRPIFPLDDITNLPLKLLRG